MAGISVPGVGSGLDINALVTQLVAVERAPAQNQINQLRSLVLSRISALGGLNAALDGVKSAFTALSDGSAFTRRTATSGDTAVLTVAAASAAVPGQFAVEVIALASAQKLASGVFASASTVVGTGTLTVSANGKSSALTIDASNSSLAGIRDAINAAADNPGVDATLVVGTAGTQLVLSARSSGVAGAISVTASGGNGGLSALTFVAGGLANGLTQITAGQDAQAKIDGIAVTSAGNTISSAISGVTLSLVSAKPGTPVNVTVAVDKAAATSAIGNFVTKYNALVGTSLQLASFNATTGSAGPLLGDSTLRAVRNDLSQALATRTTGTGLSSLSDIGIRVGLDGTLSLDSTALTKALDAGQQSVATLVSKNGALGTALGKVFDRFLGAGGTLVSRSASLNSTQVALDKQQAQLDLRIAATETRLRTQFTALDSLLSKLQSTSSFLTQQLTGATSAK